MASFSKRSIIPTPIVFAQVTPLHQDPSHNLFCQVRGCKYIRLYQTGSGEALAPHTCAGRLAGTRCD